MITFYNSCFATVIIAAFLNITIIFEIDIMVTLIIIITTLDFTIFITGIIDAIVLRIIFS